MKKPKVDPKKIGALFERAIPEPRIELDFKDPWQLLIATILSAQSTDKRVNLVTPVLFERWRTPAALGAASQEDVEEVVKSTGFFRNKAKAIRGASAMIAEKHGGVVPKTMEELCELPGVARKTANLVLGGGYGIASGIVIDTHAGRVARRLALTREEDPVEVEQALCASFPEKAWIALGQRLILHGRYVCTAKDPKCSDCPLNEVCAAAEAKPDGTVDRRIKIERAILSGPR